MPRTFSAGDLIQLPRLDAASAVSLGAALETAAKGAGQLPASVDKARKALGQALTELRDVHAARLPAKAASASEQTAADGRLDAAWAGTFGWLKGFERLPAGTADEQASIASGLLATLFPDDLRFTQLRYRQQWAESDARLRRIDKDGLDKRFEALGGAVFLGAVRKTHADYGQALGITHVAAPDAQAPRVREALDAFVEALRAYALKVSASVEPDEPQTEALAQKLLAPLTTFETRPAPVVTEPEPVKQ